MCCLVAVLLFLGPRAGVVLWWLFDRARWDRAFDTIIIPIIGFLFLPWTTLAYVLVFSGGLSALDWILLVIALLVDLGSYGGGYRNRAKIRR
jgi:hypothetical protein